MKKSNSSSLVSIITKEIDKNLVIYYTDNSNEITSENSILEKDYKMWKTVLKQ